MLKAEKAKNRPERQPYPGAPFVCSGDEKAAGKKSAATLPRLVEKLKTDHAGPVTSSNKGT